MGHSDSVGSQKYTMHQSLQCTPFFQVMRTCKGCKKKNLTLLKYSTSWRMCHYMCAPILGKYLRWWAGLTATKMWQQWYQRKIQKNEFERITLFHLYLPKHRSMVCPSTVVLYINSNGYCDLNSAIIITTLPLNWYWEWDMQQRIPLTCLLSYLSLFQRV